MKSEFPHGTLRKIHKGAESRSPSRRIFDAKRVGRGRMGKTFVIIGGGFQGMRTKYEGRKGSDMGFAFLEGATYDQGDVRDPYRFVLCRIRKKESWS
jgi:hypothetical protein